MLPSYRSHTLWHPFSRSYGVILPSSLTIVLPFALEFSSHPPVSVYGTGTSGLDSGFSRQLGVCSFATKNFAPHHPLRLSSGGICLPGLSTGLDALNQRRALHILLCPHFSQTTFGGTGISTCCPSPTPLGLSLGPD